MAVRSGKLEFWNVVGMKTRSEYGSWQEEAMKLRAFLVKNDIFITGPVILQWDNVTEDHLEADLCIYLPTYQRLRVEENDMFFYQEQLFIPKGLKIRHGDMADDLKATEALLFIFARKAGLTLKKPYYYIYLPVFQEYIVDVFAPVEEGGAYDLSEGFHSL